MHYFELPSKKKQLWITVGTVVIYGIIFAITDTFFPEFSPEVKKKLSQGGLMIIFLSGLLAGQSYLWSSKVQHNKVIAEAEIEKYDEYIEILKSQQEDIPNDFSAPIKNAGDKLAAARGKLDEVENHPSFVLYSGKLSLILLALGTMSCNVGEG